MKIEDYEKYHQQGGTYVLPVEIFNELLNELENWKEETQQLKDRINKAIEYINQLEHSEWVSFGRTILLEILKGE